MSTISSTSVLSFLTWSRLATVTIGTYWSLSIWEMRYMSLARFSLRGREEAEVVYFKFNTFLITARPHLRSFALNYSLHLMTTKQLCLTNVGIWTGAPLRYFSLQLLHAWMLYLCNCELHRFLKCNVAAHVFTFSKYFSHPVFHNLTVLFWFLSHRGFCPLHAWSLPFWFRYFCCSFGKAS